MPIEFWIAIFGILVPVLTLFGGFFAFVYREIKELRLDTKKETESITASIKKETETIREEIKSNREQADRLFEQQNARSDKLYQMFIDLLKDRHRTNP